MNVSTEFSAHPFGRCWDVSVRMRVVRHTNAAIPRAAQRSRLKKKEAFVSFPPLHIIELLNPASVTSHHHCQVWVIYCVSGRAWETQSDMILRISSVMCGQPVSHSSTTERKGYRMIDCVLSVIWGLCVHLIHVVICVSNVSNRDVKLAVLPLWLA